MAREAQLMGMRWLQGTRAKTKMKLAWGIGHVGEVGSGNTTMRR